MRRGRILVLFFVIFEKFVFFLLNVFNYRLFLVVFRFFLGLGCYNKCFVCFRGVFIERRLNFVFVFVMSSCDVEKVYCGLE